MGEGGGGGKVPIEGRGKVPIEGKVALLIELDGKAVSATILSKRYGMGQSTNLDINMNRETILNLLQNVIVMGMNTWGKIMKLGEGKKHDDEGCVYLV